MHILTECYRVTIHRKYDFEDYMYKSINSLEYKELDTFF